MPSKKYIKGQADGSRAWLRALLDEIHSSSWTRWPNTTAPTSISVKNAPLGDGVVWLRRAPSTGATCASSARTPRCLAAYGGCTARSRQVRTGDPRPTVRSSSTTVLARIQEGVVSLGLYSHLSQQPGLRRHPQISLIMGPPPLRRLLPALTDFVIMVPSDQPDVHHRARRHQDRHRREVTMEELGAHAHGQVRYGTLRRIRRTGRLRLRSRAAEHLPLNNSTKRAPIARIPDRVIERTSATRTSEWIDWTRPTNDMHEVITRHDDEFLEIQAGYAQNIVVGFGRIDGAGQSALSPTSRHTSPAAWISTPRKA